MSDGVGDLTEDRDRAARKAARRQAREARKIPLAALTLGAAGLLPPFIAILARLATDAETPISGLLMPFAVSYGLLILSFLGGIWWGVASARASEEQQASLLGLAVAPPILAAILFVVAQVFPVIATFILAIALAATLLVDRRLAQLALVPVWWMRLRMPLSLALAAMAVIVGVLLMI
jgi:hypothetical protein